MSRENLVSTKDKFFSGLLELSYDLGYPLVVTLNSCIDD